jgi:hypothetical protein
MLIAFARMIGIASGVLVSAVTLTMVNSNKPQPTTKMPDSYPISYTITRKNKLCDLAKSFPEHYDPNLYCTK